MALRVRKYRVLHYKSCVDSGDCWLSPHITLLAGKNESGKSAMLEGFSRTYNQDSVGLVDRNMADLDRVPSCLVNFEIAESELSEVLAECDVQLDDNFRTDIIQNGLTIEFRSGSPPTLTLPPEAYISDPVVPAHDRDKAHQALSAIHAALEQNGHAKPSAFKSLIIDDYKLPEFRAMLASLPPDPTVSEQVSTIQMLLPSEANGSAPPHQRLTETLQKSLPRVIFFSDEIDIVQYETPLADAVNVPAIQRLARIAQLDLKALIDERDTQSRKVLLSRHTATISNLFKLSWLQEEINVKFDVSGDQLLVEFWEQRDPNHTPYRMEQRSKGFQWYVSFFSRLQGEPLKDCVVLIDEPGLYLHAKAQKDLLAELERTRGNIQQILFSTHSPYMIDGRKPERVRTVTRTDNIGTKVQNKIHADADLETITPILTAIGDEVGLGIHRAGHGDNVVWEGPSDPLFVRAVATIMDASDILELNHIGCMGASNVPLVCAILHGWGTNYMAIFDNDREGRLVMEEMKKRFYNDAPCTLVSETDGYSIEDLFSKEFFAAYVAGEQIAAGKANSKLLKDVGDKVIHAKMLLERAETNPQDIVIDRQTKAAFEALFDKIRRSLELTIASPV